MSTIVTRTGKGSALTWAEADANFTNLNTDKAELASPTFTGTPAAPTASPGENTTQVATTAFVTTADNLKANLASPTFTGTPAAPTASVGTNTTQVATTAYVKTEIPSVAYTKTEIDTKYKVLVVATRASGGQSVAASYVPTTIIYDTETTDPTSIYNNTTGVITIAEAGLYQFNASCRYLNGSTGGDVSMSINRASGSGNGSCIAAIYDLVANQQVFPHTIAVYNCSAGDTFNAKVTAQTAGTVADGGASNNVLIVSRIG